MNLDMQRKLEKYAGPDHWNDPDMLEVGNGGLTVNEERAHFSLWCMLAAPLIAGNDLRHMTRETTNILTNREMIAIDQDSLGKQGSIIIDKNDYQVYMKPLSHGDTSICLFNRGDATKDVIVNWGELKIGNDFKLRDVWKHANVGTTATAFKASIPKHDVVVLKLIRK
jgi:alpha-galactosidase